MNLRVVLGDWFDVVIPAVFFAGSALHIAPFGSLLEVDGCRSILREWAIDGLAVIHRIDLSA